METANFKKVIDACKNYYDIIEERYTKDDNITGEILKYYKYKIENTDAINEEELKKTVAFDECVYAYFNDDKFHDEFIMKLNNLDKQCDLVEFMLLSHQSYINDPTNKVTTTKWI